MIMPLVLLAIVVAFQGLALVGNLVAPRPVWLLGVWALLAAVVFGLGYGGVFPWLASGVLCGLLVRRAVDQGLGVWKCAAVGLLPVLIASGLPFVLDAPDVIWEEFERQVEALVAFPPGSESATGAAERALVERQRQLALTAGRWMLRLFPAELVVLNLFQVLGVVGAAAWLARRRGAATAVLPITHWSVPFGTIWVLAATMLLLTFRWLPLTIVAWNAALVVSALLSVQGTMVFLQAMGRHIPLRWRVLLLAVCALTALPLLMVFTALLGVADLWVDFRKLRTPLSGIAKGGED